MELGKPQTTDFVRQAIRRIRTEHGGRTVLLGGPPCQSYSVVGRARNTGNVWYDPNRDGRQALYKEYVSVLRQLRPMLAVMENVRGMLSAQHAGQPIFPEVMRELQRGSEPDGYRLFALASRSSAHFWDEGAEPKDFLVHTEDHGVPQTRHRVFVLCIRRDVARALPDEILPRLEPGDSRVPSGRHHRRHAKASQPPQSRRQFRRLAGVRTTRLRACRSQSAGNVTGGRETISLGAGTCT